MTKERWQEAKEKIQSMFSVTEHGTQEEDVGTFEWIEFEGPGAKKMRLEWHDRPKKLGEKTITSKRIGAEVKIESEYSDTDRSQFIVLKTWDEVAGDWIESKDASAFL